MVGWVIKNKESKTMKKFPRGTILKLTCDVHEFLAKAPKAYDGLIDVIDSKGKVKVLTHNGDYVGLYGMKAKIHTRFMKQFEVVGEMPCDDTELITVKAKTQKEIKDDLASDLVGEVTKWCEDAKPELAQERVELKLALLEEVTDSLAKAASKLNSLGYEFGYGEWLSQNEINKRKLHDIADKVYEMTALEIAQLLIDNNIEL